MPPKKEPKKDAKGGAKGAKGGKPAKEDDKGKQSSVCRLVLIFKLSMLMI